MWGWFISHVRSPHPVTVSESVKRASCWWPGQFYTSLLRQPLECASLDSAAGEITSVDLMEQSPVMLWGQDLRPDPVFHMLQLYAKGKAF